MKNLLACCLLVLAPLVSVAETATKEITPLPKGVSSFGAVTVGDYLYVYGGHAGKAHSYSKDTTSGEFQRLNLSNPKEWEKLDGGISVQGTALVAHGDKIYRVGGLHALNSKEEKTDIRSQASVSVFDTKTLKWSDITPLPEARSSHDAVVVGDTLFVFGGWQLNGGSTAGRAKWLEDGLSLNLANPKATWESIKQPFQRRALTMAAFDNKVYIIGGLGEKATDQVVNIYDPSTKQWSTGAKMPGDAGNAFSPAAAVLGNNLFLTAKDGIVYQLNAKKDGWETVATLKQARFVARMVGHGKSVYVVAGASPTGMMATLEQVAVVK